MDESPTSAPPDADVDGRTKRATVAVVATVATDLAAAAAALWLVGQRDDAPARFALAALGTVALVVGWRAWSQRDRPGRSRRACVATAVVVVTTATATMYIGAATPTASWFGGGVVHGPTDRREVAITFDDGPDGAATPQIMAILDRYGVDATFFVVGKAVDRHPEIVRALQSSGHLVANHSYHHDQWRWLDPRYPELQRTQDAIERATGTCPALYRPPHGERTPFIARVVDEHSMTMVLWSGSGHDWEHDSAATIAARILRAARPGAILLLHDGLDGIDSADRSAVIAALPIVLDGLRAKGLRPVRLDEMLSTSATVPCR